MLLQALLRYTAHEEFSRNPLSLDSKRKTVSPPFLNTGNARRAWSTACSTRPPSCSSSEARQPSHPCLTSLWLPWTGQARVAPTCPAVVWMPPQWKYWRTEGPKTSAELLWMLLFTVAIVLLYSQILWAFIPSSVSTSDNLFQVLHLYSLVADKILNIIAHLFGSSYLTALLWTGVIAAIEQHLPLTSLAWLAGPERRTVVVSDSPFLSPLLPQWRISDGQCSLRGERLSLLGPAAIVNSAFRHV